VALRIIYRISDGGNPKVKLDQATKKHCLENCILEFGKENITLFADNCGSETLQMISDLGLNFNQISLGNAMSWRHVCQFAIQNFDPKSAIYLLEDDYLHRPGSRLALMEGLEIGDYATLYDHPDKYISTNEGGPNPYITNKAEESRIWCSTSCHWKQTNSTTMTFATRINTLMEDWPVWMEFTSKGFPNDFGAFQRLQGIGNWENRLFGKKRILVSSVPGFSTHAESAWLSPHTDWTKI
jgi:hypothetical protein